MTSSEQEDKLAYENAHDHWDKIDREWILRGGIEEMARYYGENDETN